MSAARNQAGSPGTGDPGKSRRLVRTGDRLCPAQVFEFVNANRARYPVATMCRVLEVSPSGYYAWRKRAVSQRSQEDALLTDRIRTIHTRSKGTYGAPRIQAELADEGVHVGCKRVARLIPAGHRDGVRPASLQGVSRRKHPWTTVRAVGAQPAPDLVERDFTTTGPDWLWVADITYIPTWSGFLYLSVVEDAWSRRIVGWSTLAPAA